MVSKMMEATWRWKDEASKATEGMTPEQLAEHYRNVRRRAEKQFGVKFKTRRRKPGRGRSPLNAPGVASDATSSDTSAAIRETRKRRR